MSYRIDEIMRCLSIREFISLCNLIDQFGPETEVVGHAGTHTVKGHLTYRRFNIAKIDRGAYKIKVLVDYGHAAVLWHEIPLETAKAKVA